MRRGRSYIAPWIVASALLVSVALAPRAGAHEERDPVCGMLVDPHATSHTHAHGGRDYFF